MVRDDGSAWGAAQAEVFVKDGTAGGARAVKAADRSSESEEPDQDGSTEELVGKPLQRRSPSGLETGLIQGMDEKRAPPRLHIWSSYMNGSRAHPGRRR